MVVVLAVINMVVTNIPGLIYELLDDDGFGTVVVAIVIVKFLILWNIGF